MAFDISRRFLLTGSAGAAVAGLTACATSSAGSAVAQGAFTPENASVENPYLLGAPEGVALLSRNENPYGPAQSAKDMIAYAASKGAYYTSGEATMMLKEMIAERHGVTPDHVALSTGSGEILSAIALHYGPNGPIVAPRLFWDTTALYASNLGMAEISRVPLTAGMEIDLPAMESMVTESTGLVQLCNPNNPTGLVLPGDVIRPAVARMAAKTTVVVDEAYIELANDEEGTTCIPLIKEGHDVIVTRTFSKIYGMAGIRMGYLIAKPETAQKIQSVVMSWTPSTSIAAAIGSYNDMDFINFSKGKIVEAREMVTTTLDALGLEYLPSQTNFVYFKSGKEANAVQEAMASRMISVRGQYMDYNEWTRVSMGFIEDVDRFCKALPEVLA
ncbi:histidinol-phosphate transaminase [Ponticaulis sp.]|uniref:pyridoxal phosphate-dependent aminotransferase n=1 Tax=Ponticaulis sp. TaxID=2020902 RepID=UPI000B65C1E1|nr:histidinol-phosphate transaminase [Ponticaulis sp.]MAI90576.1 classes I and II aminotransferase [Ponticaulis sp.]OUX99092.1 MAG: classes I and II aminotransferase [Hyphomonadaceae bacterium TMED5]|tara:strand:- start:13534 stop:14697 length:1164 start_codon:yes stop_codon:yes gene_type:complete